MYHLWSGFRNALEIIKQNPPDIFVVDFDLTMETQEV